MGLTQFPCELLKTLTLPPFIHPPHQLLYISDLIVQDALLLERPNFIFRASVEI
jgi:hypothetical protein